MRVTSIRFIAALVVLVGAAFIVRAADETPKAAKEKEAKAIKLTKPWSDLALTDEQKTRVHEIHQKALASIKEIRAKEEADIMAVLSDEQRAELKKLEAQEKADAKMKKGAGAEAGKEPEEPRPAQ